MQEFSVVIIEPRNDRERRIKEAYAETRGPLPPFNELNGAGCYWLSQIDSDGRVWPPVPFQWQPGVKQWCRVGDVATGRDVDLKGWVVVAHCEMPEPRKIHFTETSIIVQSQEA